MDQATRRDTAPARELEAHYALSEQQKYKLHLVTRSLEALSRLTCPGEMEQARCDVAATQEDLAALFELIRLQIEDASGELPFVTASGMAGEVIVMERFG